MCLGRAKNKRFSIFYKIIFTRAGRLPIFSKLPELLRDVALKTKYFFYLGKKFKYRISICQKPAKTIVYKQYFYSRRYFTTWWFCDSFSPEGQDLKVWMLAVLMLCRLIGTWASNGCATPNHRQAGAVSRVFCWQHEVRSLWSLSISYPTS